MTVEYLTTHDAPCRPCRGKGYTLDYEPDSNTYEMRQQSNTCHYCGGTGKQSVRVTTPTLTPNPLSNPTSTGDE